MDIYTPLEVMLKIAFKARRLRLQNNLKQQTLSKKANVSLASIKRFENTGEISLKSLLKIAGVLNCSDDFFNLFPEINPNSINEITKIGKDSRRKRGRK